MGIRSDANSFEASDKLSSRPEASAPAWTASEATRKRLEARLTSRRNLVAMTAVVALLVIAAVLRTLQYVSNTSFSVDEAALTLNVAHRPYSGLFHELDFNQGAPPAFLLLEKLALRVFGNSEYAFRAVPFFAGILSLLLVIPFSRRFVRKAAAVEVVALALVGFSVSLILYSATAKPYALDVLLTLLLYVLAAELTRTSNPGRLAMFAIAGAIAIWLSFAAIFVLAGVGVTLVVRSSTLRRWREAATFLLAGVGWLASFVLLYFVSLRNLGHLERSLPSPSGAGGANPLNTAQSVGGALRFDLGIGHLDVRGLDVGQAVVVLTILLALIGLAVLARELPVAAALLLTPAVFMLIASELGHYPLFARTLLFLAPAFVAFVTCGALRVATAPRLRAIGILGLSVVLIFVIGPASKILFHPQETARLKQALRYLSSHQRASDTVWVYHASQYALRYYLECRCFGDASLVRTGEQLWPLHPAEGAPDQFAPTLKSVRPRFIVSRSVGYSTAYQMELRALRGRTRVWILISDAAKNIRDPIVAFLDRLGTERLVFEAGHSDTAAAVYLYDLSRRH